MRGGGISRLLWLLVGLGILAGFLVGGWFAPDTIIKTLPNAPSLWPLESPVHVMEEGESLRDLTRSMKGARAGVTTELLREWNGLSEADPDPAPGTPVRTFVWDDPTREGVERSLGTNREGQPLMEFALQGARIITFPALVAGLLVMFLATLAGLSRCAGFAWLDTVLQAFQEVAGALPRLVVILVVATILPALERSPLVTEWGLPLGRGLLIVGLTWAILVAPSAMDEAAASAGRLGGARFVEALRAHGFTAPRIYLYHITWLNLRPVLVRQAAEVVMQVAFLEIALSYLAARDDLQALTHTDSDYSWASLLYFGFQSLVLQEPFFGADSQLHALIVALALLGLVALMAQAFRMAARAR